MHDDVDTATESHFALHLATGLAEAKKLLFQRDREIAALKENLKSRSLRWSDMPTPNASAAAAAPPGRR